MTRQQNTTAIERATGTAWSKWCSWLASEDADNVSHKEIAMRIEAKLKGATENDAWWAQAIAVAYEQSTGRRLPGQRSDGTFEVSVSTTVVASADQIKSELKKTYEDQNILREVRIDSVSESDTPVRSYVRVRLSDGTLVTWSIEATSSNKVKVVVVHSKLPSQQAATEWRDYWKQYSAKELQW